MVGWLGRMGAESDWVSGESGGTVIGWQCRARVPSCMRIVRKCQSLPKSEKGTLAPLRDDLYQEIHWRSYGFRHTPS